MNWKHPLNQDWFEARRKYLTASDIASLEPEYRKIMKQGAVKTMPLQFLKLYLGKQQPIDEVEKYGAAARGNELEPFAVGSYNNWSEAKIQTEMYHTDDKLIVGKDLAWSPDAIDIQLPSGIEFDCNKYTPKKLLEIKSYGIENHVNAYYTDKHKERFQIATAMVVSPVEEASLVFFNPSAKGMQMFERYYTRDDLKEEMETVLGILQVYKITIEHFNEGIENTFNEVPWTEEEINQMVYEKQQGILAKDIMKDNNPFNILNY